MRKVLFGFLLLVIVHNLNALSQENIGADNAAEIVKQAESKFEEFHFDSAILKFQTAIDLYKQKNDKQGLADTHYKLGIARIRISKFNEALIDFNEALKLHQELQIQKSIADDLTGIARIQMNQGDYEKALATSKKARAIHEEIGNKKGIADTLRVDATCYDYLGDYKKSLELAGRCIEIYIEIKDNIGVAVANSAQGSSYWKMGDLDLAIEKFEKALALAKETGDLRGQGNYEGNIGLVYWNKGDMPLALEHTMKSLDIAKQTGNAASEATGYFNLALMLTEQGNYREAMEKFQKSLTMAQEHDDKGLIGVCLEGLGKLYKYYGDYDRALEYYKKSYAIAKEIGEKRAEAYAIAATGYVYEHYKKYSMAIDSFEKAYRLYEEMDEKRGIAKMHESIGNVRLDMKKYDAALKDFYASLKILESIGAKYEMAESYRLVGVTNRKMNQFEDAEKALTQSIQYAKENDLVNTLWMSLHEKGLVLKELGRSEEAIASLEEGVGIIEKMRTQLEDIEQRAAYLEERFDIYEDTIQILVASNKIPEAFEYVQRSKARAFLDMLAEAEINSDSSLSPELRDRRKTILADLIKSQKNLQDEKNKETPDAAKLNQLKNKQNLLEQQYADLILEIRNANPMYAEVQYPEPLKLADAQKLLNDEDLLLEYFLGNSGSVLFVASRENVSVFKLKSQQVLAKLVNDLRDVMMKPDPIYDASEKTYSQYVTLAQSLYAEILKPAESILQNKLRIVIAPDGALSYLPFEALLTQKVKTAEINFANLPYVACDFEIDYVPSISVLASIEKNKMKEGEPPQKQLLAFADPVLKGNEKGKASEVRSWAGTLTRLPFAREEVEGIARFYSDKDVSVVVGSDASEANLKKMNLSEYRKLHFASHGLIDEEKPEFSALVLTGDNQGEDGYLTMREVFDLKLNADLVVLSACKSGLGKEIRGEGITGISRAFLCAGTPSVLVSLWDVYDRSTADLMTSFYRNLETKGLNKAAALRAARLEMIQSKKFSHPYYWAPFVLIGQR